MNKKEFIGKVSEKAGITKKMSKEIYDVIDEVIGEALTDGEKLMVFGVKFDVKEVGETSGKISAKDGQLRVWSKPARVVPCVKMLKSTKEKYTR